MAYSSDYNPIEHDFANINTGWLWVIAPTDTGQGGQNSTDYEV